MDTLILTVLLALAVGAQANKEPCNSGQYTSTGECCLQCMPGEGVVSKCGDKQTECAPCADSETFSENPSHTEPCLPCTRCLGHLRMYTPCTDSNDAVCVCTYGYYRLTPSAPCEPCTICPLGYGVLLRCMPDRDTTCEECEANVTYSDMETWIDPCLPCSTCEDDEEEEQKCTQISDRKCLGPNSMSSVSPTMPEETSPPTFVELTFSVEPIFESTTPGPGPFMRYRLNKNLILIYSSILVAVVVGIVAFVIFKRWSSCKKNKQGANNCSANQNQNPTPSPEGEKLHSDSGISVDSQSLQEQQGQQSQLQTVVTLDEEPCLLLPLHTREEMERLLHRGGEADARGVADGEEPDWCNLAGLLGYEDERIASFRREKRPVQALLSDWASQGCASMDTLCAALRKINRDDVAQGLAANPDATSAV